MFHILEIQPIKSLCAFKRVATNKGEKKIVTLMISAYSLTTVLEDGSRVFLKGDYRFMVGDKETIINIK